MTLSFQVAPSVAVSLPRYLRYPSLLRVHCPGLSVPDVFPNDGSVLDRPLPYSQALPGGIRLFSTSTTRQLRLPLRVLPSPLRVEGQYRGADSAFSLPPARESKAVGPGCLYADSPIVGSCAHGRIRFSQVPREPQCIFALLSDPGRSSTPSHCGVSVLPTLGVTTLAPTSNLSSPEFYKKPTKANLCSK